MKNRILAIATGFAVLTLGACGASGGTGDGAGAEQPALSGMLLGEGYDLVQTLSLPEGSWQERLGDGLSYSATAVAADELHLAEAGLTAPLEGTVFDLRTFEQSGTWEWPVTDLFIDEVRGLAVSPDGHRAAAVVNVAFSGYHLQVLDLETGSELLTLDPASGFASADLHWVSDSEFIVAMRTPDSAQFAGAIVRIDTDQAGAAPEVVIGFSAGPADGGRGNGPWPGVLA